MKSEVTLTEINEKLKLYQYKDGLTFGTDAYLLYAYMKKRTKDTACDFGSGTGIISLLSASKGKYAKIHACELQKDYSDLIEKNVIENGLTDKIIAHNCDICSLTPDYFDDNIGVVFTNPPYMKVDSGKSNEFDIKNIARHETCGSIYDFCSAASRTLKHGGYFYCVYRPDRLCDLIDALRINNLEPKRMTFVHARVELSPCLVLVEAKKGAGASVSITKPLIMYNADQSYTEDLNFIYENGEFDEQYK
ncbi:MAG: methyltransferase [Clostridia bacterium]|nr:methyltransferase [Clostridia bacterium]